jgi:hypothetical protein
MTDYTKSTNFASKDSLPSGDPLKIVKGTEINTEFDNIATAVATKADNASATLTNVTISSGTITGITDLAIADGGTGASTAANARTNLGLVIGTNVQAWDADLDTWATKTAPSGTVVGTTDTQTLTNKTINGGALQSATAVASTSGTSIDFTSIPSWVKRITVMFQGVSSNGSSPKIIQIGNSGGIETSGYVSGSVKIDISNGVNFTSGFVINSQSAADVISGTYVLSLQDSTNNGWVGFGCLGGNANVLGGGGKASMASTLDRVRITTVGGTDTFDAGSINILYE